ncbi:uncharacterized protein LOC117826322 [Xyrichtys novacula]|uniref:Uncharacterized protein LOC117826322 n=1 Tax=Xyrichtys novacula TaxID=13765 RepID=A0AAV1GI90_XYRNO|nr:uncharacterized protein LOC117826322 [Xyrichtys novacula]
MWLFLGLGLLVCIKAEVTPVFVHTGQDLFLDVQKPVTLEQDDLLIWSFSDRKDVARLRDSGKTEIIKDYYGRAELCPQKQSLLLRNVTKSDSGVYKAFIYGYNPKHVAEYNVTVLDARRSFADIFECKQKMIVICSGLAILLCAIISVHIIVKVKKRK